MEEKKVMNPQNKQLKCVKTPIAVDSISKWIPDQSHTFCGIETED